jgi:16S rRNA (adenine1518-N6/adenine1519-N6)-dimethyltransferase
LPRRLGQHFLTNSNILERIAVAACPEPADLVIEIGPGKGSLTQHLLKHAARVVAIEIDTILVHYLQQKFKDEARLTIVNQDVLKANLGDWGPAVIAGNLPYYITSPILEKVFASGKAWTRAAFLVQKEVAERITAQPGSRDYGYLSVQTQSNARAKILFGVGRGAFHPPPKVESAVFSLERIEPPVEDLPAFLRFASVAFRHKRKTLRNNLLEGFPRERVEALDIGSKRAEQLAIPELARIWKRLIEYTE